MKTPEEEQLLERNLAQIKDALSSPENRYYAAEALGHDPTEEELLLWFIEHGGARHFAEVKI